MTRTHPKSLAFLTKSTCDLECPDTGRARRPNAHTLLFRWSVWLRPGTGKGRKERVECIWLSWEDFAIGVRDETSSLIREKS